MYMPSQLVTGCGSGCVYSAHFTDLSGSGSGGMFNRMAMRPLTPNRARSASVSGLLVSI